MKHSLLSFFATIIVLSGCGGRSDSPSSVSATATPNPTAAPETSAITAGTLTAIAMSNASSTVCVNGGSVINLFSDLNFNGVLDSNEAIISSTPVCNGNNGSNGANGATGSPGTGSGVVLGAAALASCAAGGTTITTFQDKNSNAALDIGESITSTSTICNGVAGSNGLDGAASYITSTAANSSQCSNGGVVYSTHTDYQSPQISIVCNGTNGSNGTNGVNGNNAVWESGAVGPSIANRNYTACHHDYIYIPESSESGRGWLIFRHQLNGAADQGIGTTGFNVWNVDISDFNLASEQAGINYCQLHWDPNSKTLSYTVLDNSDGLAGTTGSIHL